MVGAFWSCDSQQMVPRSVQGQQRREQAYVSGLSLLHVRVEGANARIQGGQSGRHQWECVKRRAVRPALLHEYATAGEGGWTRCSSKSRLGQGGSSAGRCRYAGRHGQLALPRLRSGGGRGRGRGQCAHCRELQRLFALRPALRPTLAPCHG